MKNYEQIKKNLETRKDWTAWDKDVTYYALEMLDDVSKSIDRTGKEPETKAELKALVLNGVECWEEYNWVEMLGEEARTLYQAFRRLAIEWEKA